MVCAREILVDGDTQELEWLNLLKQIVRKLDWRVYHTASQILQIITFPTIKYYYWRREGSATFKDEILLRLLQLWEDGILKLVSFG